MGATNHTSNYNLPQWIGTDKPTFLGDLNDAFLKIDTQMKANANSVSSAESAAGSAESAATAASKSASQALEVANNSGTKATQAINIANNASYTANNAQQTANAASLITTPLSSNGGWSNYANITLQSGFSVVSAPSDLAGVDNTLKCSYNATIKLMLFRGIITASMPSTDGWQHFGTFPSSIPKPVSARYISYFMLARNYTGDMSSRYCYIDTNGRMYVNLNRSDFNNQSSNTVSLYAQNILMVADWF